MTPRLLPAWSITYKSQFPPTVWKAGRGAYGPGGAGEGNVGAAP